MQYPAVKQKCLEGLNLNVRFIWDDKAIDYKRRLEATYLGFIQVWFIDEGVFEKEGKARIEQICARELCRGVQHACAEQDYD